MMILIKGAGDLATGVAHRLYQCGFSVVMTEISRPTTVRCTVAFSQAVYQGTATVEGVTACLADTPQQALALLEKNQIPVLVDPEATCVASLRPQVVVDAILAKRNLGTKLTDAPLVIALGPGFTAGVDCHAVVETKRGHSLGRVLLTGTALPNTGIPGNIGGFTSQRILRSTAQGVFQPLVKIGDLVHAGDVVAQVDGAPVCAQIDGMVRGLLPAGTRVVPGMKSGDVDPRGSSVDCFTISDNARAIGGGVLEAILGFSEGGRLK